jgi:hypothetical protein
MEKDNELILERRKKLSMEKDNEFVLDLIKLIRTLGEDARTPALVASQLRELIEAERERCALIAEDFSKIETLSEDRKLMAQSIAESIRFTG